MLKICRFTNVTISVFTISMLATPVLCASSCVLVGGIRAPAQLKVYVEKNDDTKGALLWEGTIQRDQKITINSPTERIIYDHRFDDRDPWQMNTHAWCRSNSEEKVP